MKDIISDAILAAMICNHKTFFLVTCNRRQQHQQKNNNDISDHLKDNNQQVVHKSKKPTDSSNNSMKGVKISILSGPLNSMTLEPLSLNEGDNRQQEQERRANGDMKNLIMTSTLCSCYLMQNMVIDQTKYLLDNANLCGVNQGEGARKPACQSNDPDKTQPPWELSCGQNNRKMINNLIPALLSLDQATAKCLNLAKAKPEVRTRLLGPIPNRVSTSWSDAAGKYRHPMSQPRHKQLEQPSSVRETLLSQSGRGDQNFRQDTS